MTVGRGAAPGWYPVAPEVEQWWNGTAWGTEVRPIRAAQPATPRRAVTYSRKRTSHGLHLFLTIITGGLWGIFVWLPVTLINGMRREKEITRYR